MNCWNWPRGKTVAGYGRLTFNGREVYAHRLLKIIIENLPLDLMDHPEVVFRHSCDNPACVNPLHLELGTQSDNINDRIKRGRTRHGETHPVAKLNAGKIKEIRKLAEAGEMKKQDIAKMYGICPATVTAIIKRLTWKHI